MKCTTGLSINSSHRKVTTPSSRDNGPIPGNLVRFTVRFNRCLPRSFGCNICRMG